MPGLPNLRQHWRPVGATRLAAKVSIMRLLRSGAGGRDEERHGAQA